MNSSVQLHLAPMYTAGLTDLLAWPTLRPSVRAEEEEEEEGGMCGHTDPVRARFGWAKERDAMSASFRDLGLYSGREDVCHL